MLMRGKPRGTQGLSIHINGMRVTRGPQGHTALGENWSVCGPHPSPLLRKGGVRTAPAWPSLWTTVLDLSTYGTLSPYFQMEKTKRIKKHKTETKQNPTVRLPGTCSCSFRSEHRQSCAREA